MEEKREEKRKLVYKALVEVGSSYTGDWVVSSRVLELNKDQSLFQVEVEGGPEDQTTELYFSVVALGPFKDVVISSRRVWRDCFFDESKFPKAGELAKSEALAPAPVVPLTKSAKRRMKARGESRGSQSSSRPLPPNATKFLVIRGQDLPFDGINKVQIRLRKPKTGVFSYFKKVQRLELSFRVETHVVLQGHVVDDINFEFSGKIWQFLEPFRKIPLQEMLMPRLPSKGRVFRKPVVLLLGGHSSGKSSFINMILGEKAMETGSSPTTEEFVVLDYSSEKRVQRNVDLEDFPFDGVFSIPNMSSYISKRTLPGKFLKRVLLVDSPGVVDNQVRPYDFPAAAEFMAREADLVLFFFNFEHAESVEVIQFFKRIHRASLEHQRYVLRILNRIDTADSVKDFAKTFATLMVNLNRVPDDSPSSKLEEEESSSQNPEIATGWLFPHWPEYYEMEQKGRNTYLGDMNEFVQDGKKIFSQLTDTPVHCVRAKIHDTKLFVMFVLWHTKARLRLQKSVSWAHWRFYLLCFLVLLMAAAVSALYLHTFESFESTSIMVGVGVVLCIVLALLNSSSSSTLGQIVDETCPSLLLPPYMADDVERALETEIDLKKFNRYSAEILERCHDIVRVQHPALENELSEASLASKQMGYMDLDFE